MKRIYKEPELTANDTVSVSIICASELTGKESGSGEEGGEL